MVLLANRVSAKLPLENSTSTSSADENFLMRSKMSEACSFVSMLLNYSLCLRDSVVNSSLLVCRSHLDPSKSRRRCSVPGSHHLLWLTLAAIRRAPQSPFVAGTDCVERIPEFCRNP